MIYQFIDWRIGLYRKMFVMQVEKLLARLREYEGGYLPQFLQRREQYEAFCGEAGIAMCENWNVQSQITISEAYPSLAWLADQYTKFLEHIKRTVPDMLIDSPPIKVSKTLEEDKVLEINFSTIIDCSKSNVVDRTSEICSDHSQATSLRGSMCTDSVNSSQTAQQQRFRPHLRSTPTRLPSN